MHPRGLPRRRRLVPHRHRPFRHVRDRHGDARAPAARRGGDRGGAGLRAGRDHAGAHHVATELSELVHVTLRSVASSGLTVAVSCADAPAFKASLPSETPSPEIDTDVTGLSATVTTTEAVYQRGIDSPTPGTRDTLRTIRAANRHHHAEQGLRPFMGQYQVFYTHRRTKGHASLHNSEFQSWSNA